MRELKAGVYKHYKGGLQLVLGLAEHVGTKEKLVMYVPLGVSSGVRIKACPYREFVEEIAVRGQLLPKYLYIGESVDPAVARWYDPLSGYTGADRVDD